MYWLICMAYIGVIVILASIAPIAGVVFTVVSFIVLWAIILWGYNGFK